MQENTPQGTGPAGQQGGQQKPTLSWTQPPAQKIIPSAMPNQAAKPSGGYPNQKTGESKSNTGTYASIFVGGLIVGILIGWGVVASRSNNSAVAMDDMNAVTASSSATGTDNASNAAATQSAAAASSVNLSNSSVGQNGAGLTIPSPQQAGLQVAVSQASASAPTWVVVYEDHNGVPGNALGAGLFNAQTQSGVVYLLRGTLPGQTYLVGESLDDGDHIFSLQNDKPVRDANGNPVWVQFKTE